MNNYAYIDNQNLYLATKNAPEPWEVDMKRFMVYLKEKYKVVRAYLFMGAYDDKFKKRYDMYSNFGYQLMFRQHTDSLTSRKKGNVDTDVVFQMMYDSFYDKHVDKMILVSGDGDYFKTVKHLLEVDKLERVLLPSRKNASSLYKALAENRKALLDKANLKRRIQRK